MKCPVCKDVTLLMSEKKGVEIDYCPECRGIWLDRGELEKIMEKEDTYINKEDFFAQLNSKSNNDLQRDLKVQLLNAYSLGDKEKINTLNKQIQNSDYHTNIKISSLLIEAVVNNRVEELTYKEKNQIKRSFFEVDDWTRNITTLQLLCNSMVIFNLDELVLFMKNLEHAYEGKLDKYSFDVQRIIAAICINYFHI